ncbi:metallophosphoesterase [Desulfolucanica intricata]|uniref:metallophosphoesterase n=1 Tax=Desulfolucanica intricata TaxID=1285191 RepID=UPI0009EF02F5|nr:metallophosphoesterase [Desulfolucanica intricata]
MNKKRLVPKTFLSLKSTINGPFDIIGDVHGCLEELEILLQKLNYRKIEGIYKHPDGRTAVYLGDLADRGPHCLDTVKLVKGMVDAGTALYVPGNHCNKLARYLIGRNVQVKHGMERTVEELKELTEQERKHFANQFLELYNSVPPYLILDHGKLVVSHAGIKEDMIGRLSERIIDFCFYGDANGEVDSDGLPIRRDWAKNYKGKPLIVYGHTPVPEAKLINNTIDIDQGCCMGGYLTAFRYPEKEIVQVNALAVYYDSPRFKPIISPKKEPFEEEEHEPLPPFPYWDHIERIPEELKDIYLR